EEEAIAIANDSDYGLCGSVWTGDAEHGAEVGARVRTGVVAINSAMILDFNAPFGGFKASGIGRELGPEGIEAYTEYQTIIKPAGWRARGSGRAVRPSGPDRRRSSFSAPRSPLGGPGRHVGAGGSLHAAADDHRRCGPPAVRFSKSGEALPPGRASCRR